jgi:cytochrome P450
MAKEAGLVIVAGSDTSSMALANAIFYLLTHPTAMDRLRTELDEAADDTDFNTAIESSRLAELKYLQAVLNETMRLAPAVPSGTQRLPPKEKGSAIVLGQ